MLAALRLGLNRRRGAEVYPAPISENLLVVPDLAGGDGVLYCVERDDDAAEAAKRGPAVKTVAAWCRLGNEVPDLLEVICEEDVA